MICPACSNNTMIKVASVSGVDLYSCYIEVCSEHAELFILMEDQFIKHDVVLKGLSEAVNK